MREIKFRAWDTLNKKMLVLPVFTIASDGYVHITSNSQHYGTGQVKLMQYTGLKDKNGKEIYEGDILAWGYSKNVKTKWVVEATSGGWNPFIDSMTTDKPFRYEVIGNIYENPELMGGNND